MSQEDDLRRMRALHQRLWSRVVKSSLAGADADLRDFAASLPDEADAPEGQLRRYWDRQGLSEAGVRDFAVRFGKALAAMSEFQRFEADMEALARLAGRAEFATQLVTVAAAWGVNPPGE